MKRFLALLLLVPTLAFANPPYDLTVEQTGSASTGGVITTYELWQDCTTTPFLVDADVQTPETYLALLPADGNYNFCIRGRNPAGLGVVGLTVDVIVNVLVVPGPINSGTVITTQCPNGPCTTIITVN